MKYVGSYRSFLELYRIHNRVVLTGAGGTGKSSVIQQLHNMEYETITEPSRELLIQLKEEGGKHWWKSIKSSKIVRDILGDKLPEDSREIFQQLIETQNVNNWRKNKSGFFDRCLVDEIGFRNYYKKELPQSLINTCKTYKYDTILFFPPWKEIFQNDSERKETFQQSVEMSNYLLDGYRSMGYDPIIVPKKSIEERVNFVLEFADNPVLV